MSRLINMRSKGVAMTTVIVMLMAVVVLVAMYVNTYIADSDALERSGKEIDVIDAIDSMGFFKISLANSLQHSVYKASYDNLNKGGYYTFNGEANSNCAPYWRVYEENYIPSDDLIKENLETSILNVFECYGHQYSSSYLSLGSKMEFPDYSECGNMEIIEYGNDYKFIIEDGCNSGLQLSKGDNIIVYEENANFETIVNTNYFDLVSNGKTVFDGKRPVYDAAQKAVSEIDCKSWSKTGDDCIDGDDLLMSKCSNWENKLKESIEFELGEILVEDAQVSITVNNWDIEYEVGDCSCSSFEIEVDCGNIEDQGESNYEILDGIGECGEYCDTDKTFSFNSEGGPGGDGGDETEEAEICTEERYRTTCSYSFSVDADITVNITGDNDYPIYNSLTEQTENIQFVLKFRVIDGNAQTMTPESNDCGFAGYC